MHCTHDIPNKTASREWFRTNKHVQKFQELLATKGTLVCRFPSTILKSLFASSNTPQVPVTSAGCCSVNRHGARSKANTAGDPWSPVQPRRHRMHRTQQCPPTGAPQRRPFVQHCEALHRLYCYMAEVCKITLVLLYKYAASPTQSRLPENCSGILVPFNRQFGHATLVELQ